MIVFVVSLLLLSIVLLTVRKREFDNPIICFASIWFIVCFLYSLRLFDIFDISLKTEILLSAGILSFVAGYYVNRYFGKDNNMQNFEYNDSWQRLRLIVVAFFICSLFYYLPIAYRVVSGGLSHSVVKALSVTGDIDSGGVLMQYCLRPFEFIMIPIFAYCLITRFTKEKVIVFVSIVFPILKFLCTGSKSVFFYYFLCLLTAFVAFYTRNRNSILYFNIDKYLNSKFVKEIAFIMFFIIVLFFVFYMDLFGNGLQSLYFYSCGCVPMFDKIITTDFYLSSSHTFGFLTFNSAIRLVVKIFSLFITNGVINLFETANSYYERFEYTTYVAPNIKYNAYITMFGDFYMDFGIFGIMGLSFLFGIFTSFCYKNMPPQKNIHCFVVYCILIHYIAFSVVRFQMSNTVLGLSLIYSLTVFKTILYKHFKLRI